MDREPHSFWPASRWKLWGWLWWRALTSYREGTGSDTCRRSFHSAGSFRGSRTCAHQYRTWTLTQRGAFHAGVAMRHGDRVAGVYGVRILLAGIRRGSGACFQRGGNELELDRRRTFFPARAETGRLASFAGCVVNDVQRGPGGVDTG